MRDFKELKVWQKAHALVLAIYRCTHGFPADERYLLVTQLRRAALSIASNIAEGSGRHSDGDFARFLSMASSSTSEVECQLIIARDLDYLAPEYYEELARELQQVRRMLHAFQGTLRGERGR